MVKEFVELFNKPAYIFHNGFSNTYQYFIPICDYDDVVIDPSFDAFSYSQIIKDGKVVCDLKRLIQRSMLTGDEHLIIIPERFNDRDVPDENIIYPSEKS